MIWHIACQTMTDRSKEEKLLVQLYQIFNNTYDFIFSLITIIRLFNGAEDCIAALYN